jgi:hypothetical protein
VGSTPKRESGRVRTVASSLLYRVSDMGTGTDFFFVVFVFAAAGAGGIEGTD